VARGLLRNDLGWREHAPFDAIAAAPTDRAAAQCLRGAPGTRAAAVGTSRALVPGMGIRKVLCPIDFSASSREALATAAELARQRDAVLVLLHVIEPVRCGLDGDSLLAPSLLQDMTAIARAELEDWKLEAKRLGVKEVASRFLIGAPWDRIVATAREDDAIDLVVMGADGRTGLAQVLVGSVAEKTVRHAPCAVLVVRTREGV
jgi:nucleotide-binding universal stress UspA family protein